MMLEQRNPYQGSPERSWVRVTLLAADGTSRDFDLLADTGNPCAIIVGAEALHRFNLGLTEGMNTNFGFLQGGWLQVQMAYGSHAVLEAVKASHLNFGGMAGLPLLRMFEYGGDNDSFWVRKRVDD